MPLIELKITLDPVTGEIKTTAPFHDKMLCFGLLGFACAEVLKHEKPLIELPSYESEKK